MDFELTETQKEIAKQKILEISKSKTVLNDTTGNWDWLKKAANDIENGLPIKEDMLKAVSSLVMVFDLFGNKD